MGTQNTEISVKEKKIGRHSAWGLAWEDIKKKILLDPRLVGKKHLEILIHEVMHHQNSDWSETKVLKMSKQMANIIWKLEYRRVDNRVRQPN